MDPGDQSSIYLIFERLNTGGTQLSPMEIRKAAHFDPAFRLLEDLNNLDAWRSLLGTTKADRRFKDVEFVRRTLALTDRLHEYAKPMKGFLNEHMIRLHKATDIERESVAERFRHAVEVVADAPGPRPFHIRGRLNVAALDSVIATVMRLGPELATDMSARYSALLDDPEFVKTTTWDTSDEKVLLSRFSRVDQFLRE